MRPQLSQQEIEIANQLIKMKKLFTDDIIMNVSGAKRQYAKFSAPVYDEHGINIKGLSMRFDTNRTQAYQKHTFGLMWRKQEILYPILDLCFYPNLVVSHQDRVKRIKIKGSHLHLPNGDVQALAIDYTVHTWYDYFNLFTQHANIKFTSKRIIGAFDGELDL